MTPDLRYQSRLGQLGHEGFDIKQPARLGLEPLLGVPQGQPLLEQLDRSQPLSGDDHELA
ncbi:hypothetical protein GCM10010517_02790 [Streptosporangium fragile]|uniref:Uncharacterized protein n=1 Tax=Streptosporangium fragile TaxID=46186 RepID=A0ABN3VPT0_9ACTN